MGRKSRRAREFRTEVEAELRRSRTWRENARWGLGYGLGMALFASGYVLVASLLRDSFYYGRYDLSTWTVVGVYFAAGSAGGLALGLLRGFAESSRGGAVRVGILVGILVYGAVGVLTIGANLMTAGIAIALGCFMGALLGYRWSDPSDPFRELEAGSRRINAILNVSRKRRSRKGCPG